MTFEKSAERWGSVRSGGGGRGVRGGVGGRSSFVGGSRRVSGHLMSGGADVRPVVFVDEEAEPRACRSGRLSAPPPPEWFVPD